MSRNGAGRRHRSAGPSPAQRRVFDAIVTLTTRLGHAPAVAEIAEHVNIRTSAVHEHLVVLKAKGCVTWEEGKPRTLRVCEGAPA